MPPKVKNAETPDLVPTEVRDSVAAFDAAFGGCERLVSLIATAPARRSAAIESRDAGKAQHATLAAEATTMMLELGVGPDSDHEQIVAIRPKLMAAREKFEMAEREIAACDATIAGSLNAELEAAEAVRNEAAGELHRIATPFVEALRDQHEARWNAAAAALTAAAAEGVMLATLWRESAKMPRLDLMFDRFAIPSITTRGKLDVAGEEICRSWRTSAIIADDLAALNPVAASFTRAQQLRHRLAGALQAAYDTIRQTPKLKPAPEPLSYPKGTYGDSYEIRRGESAR